MAHIISITDFDTPELDVYARLTETSWSTGQTPPTPSLSQKARWSSGGRWRAAACRCPFSWSHGT